MIDNDNDNGFWFFWDDSSSNIGWFGLLTVLVIVAALWILFYEGTKSNYKITCFSPDGHVVMEDHVKDGHVRSRGGNFYYHINGNEKEVSGNCQVVEETIYER